MERNEEKDLSIAKGKVYERKVKEYILNKVQNSTFQIMEAEESPFWTPSLDKREGDLYIKYTTNPNTDSTFIKRLDVKHNGWVTLSGLKQFGLDEKHYYVFWNDDENHFVFSASQALAMVRKMEEDEEKTEKPCAWFEKAPNSGEKSINFTKYNKKSTIRNAYSLDKFIEIMKEE